MKSIFLKSILPLLLICCQVVSAQNPGKTIRVKSGSSTPAPSSALSFSCGSSVSDVDGNNYSTVLIETQCWMKENLKVTKTPEGNSITRKCFENNTANCNVYGGLYNWSTAMNGASSTNTAPICGAPIPQVQRNYVEYHRRRNRNNLYSG